MRTCLVLVPVGDDIPDSSRYKIQTFSHPTRSRFRSGMLQQELGDAFTAILTQATTSSWRSKYKTTGNAQDMSGRHLKLRVFARVLKAGCEGPAFLLLCERMSPPRISCKKAKLTKTLTARLQPGTPLVCALNTVRQLKLSMINVYDR